MKTAITAPAPAPTDTDTLNALLALRVRGSDAVNTDPALRPGLKAAVVAGWIKVDGWDLTVTHAGDVALSASAV